MNKIVGVRNIDTEATNADLLRNFGKPVEELELPDGTPLLMASRDQLATYAADLIMAGCTKQGQAIIGLELDEYEQILYSAAATPAPGRGLGMKILRGAIVLVITFTLMATTPIPYSAIPILLLGAFVFAAMEYKIRGAR